MDSNHFVLIAAIGLGLIIVVRHMFSELKTVASCLRDLDQRAEQEGTALRVRLVPGRFTPVSAGVACFLVTTLLVVAVSKSNSVLLPLIVTLVNGDLK